LATTTKKKSVKSKQNSSTIIFPKPVLTYPLSSKKPSPPEKKHVRPSHPAAVIRTEQEMQTPATAYHEGVYQRFTPEQIASHIPQYNVVPYSKGKTPLPLSAKQISQSRDKNILPRFFMNPYQDLDYMVLQDIYTNGRIGTADAVIL